jgi:hypothetical protein
MLISNQETKLKINMATENQIRANRINAEKSTGPKSENGKAISSQNALKTGIDAKSEIIRLENPADHAELTAAFHTRFAPATPEELSLVDALIRFEWLSRRYACVDTAIWENRFAAKDTRALGEVFLAESAKICRAVMTFNSVRRGFNATLKQLTDLQAKRAQSAPIETAAPNKPLNPKLGSFLQFPNATPEPSPTATPEPEEIAEPLRKEPETPPKAA